MLKPTPRYCQPRAYEAFVHYASDIASTKGLVAAATALSMHAIDDADPEAVDGELDALAHNVNLRVQTDSLAARMAHLHHVLFDEEGFEGNQLDFYDPGNSYLPRVLATRKGIPISLALIYKAVGERVGLEVHGIGAPGHFLLRVEDETGPLLLDPFRRGRVLGTADAYRMMEGVLGAQIPRSDDLLQPTSHADWLSRMLRNLESIHTRRAQPRDAAAMQELRRVVEG